jgi:hypothetical protein
MFLNILNIILFIFIFYFMVCYLMFNYKFEMFSNNYSQDQKKFNQNLKKTYGIAQCKYKGYTPILTCSYDSKI